MNAGSLHFTGVTVGLDYTFDVPSFGRAPGSLGGLELRVNYLDTQRLDQQIGSVPVSSLAGQLGQANTLGNAVKSKGTLDLAYHKGGFGWSWQGQFIGSANFLNSNPPDYQDYMGVHRWWVINSTLAYQFPHRVSARLIVDNVFDKQPPFPALAASGGNYTQALSLYFSGVLGRFFLIAADVQF